MTETDLTTAIRSHLTDNMFKPCANVMALNSYDVIKLDGSSPTVHIAEVSPQTGGTVSVQPIANSSVVVKLRTGIRGRSHRGRVFLPPTAEQAYSDGVIDTADAAAIQSGWASFITNMASDLAPLVVASYKLATASNVLNASTRIGTGTQRMRQTRVRLAN